MSNADRKSHPLRLPVPEVTADPAFIDRLAVLAAASRPSGPALVTRSVPKILAAVVGVVAIAGGGAVAAERIADSGHRQSPTNSPSTTPASPTDGADADDSPEPDPPSSVTPDDDSFDSPDADDEHGEPPGDDEADNEADNDADGEADGEADKDGDGDGDVGEDADQPGEEQDPTAGDADRADTDDSSAPGDPATPEAPDGADNP